MPSLREKILDVNDIKRESLHVRAWDVTVEVRTLTGAQRAAVRKGCIVTEKNSEGEDVERIDEAKQAAAIVIAATFDPETGKQLFDQADRDSLLGKSSAALDEIVAAAGRLSGLTVREQKAMEKNSDATPSVATTSA